MTATSKVVSDAVKLFVSCVLSAVVWAYICLGKYNQYKRSTCGATVAFHAI